MMLGRSFKLGVIRLTERFGRSDPLSSRDERRTRAPHSAGSSAAISTQLARRRVERVIGTSGTILSLGAMARGPRARAKTRATCASAPAPSRRLRKRLTTLTLDAAPEAARPRSAAGGPRAGRRRAARHAARRPGGRGTHALRFRAARRARPRLHPAERPATSRRSSGIRTCGAAASSNWASAATTWPTHAQQVAKLALALFDATRDASRPGRPRTRVARVRRAAARHRHAHQLRAPPQALVLPHPARRAARIRARRDRM